MSAYLPYLLKMAQDMGVSAPEFLAGLNAKDEGIIRRRTRAAAKMRHLPPDLAYALSGDVPLTSSPSTNVALHRAVSKASDPNRSKLVGAAYGLPAAAAGAVLGHLLGEGSPLASALGGAAAGGSVGYLGHRGEKRNQENMAKELVNVRAEYQRALEAAESERQMAMEQERQAQELMRMLQARQQRVAPQAGPQREQRPGRGVQKAASDMEREEKDKPKEVAGFGNTGTPFDAGSPNRLKGEERFDQTSIHFGTGGVDAGEKLAELDNPLNEWILGNLVKKISSKLKLAATGNQMAPTGVPKPPQAATADTMGANAQRETASPLPAMKPETGPKGSRPGGTSVSGSVIGNQPPNPTSANNNTISQGSGGTIPVPQVPLFSGS